MLTIIAAILVWQIVENSQNMLTSLRSTHEKEKEEKNNLPIPPSFYFFKQVYTPNTTHSTFSHTDMHMFPLRLQQLVHLLLPQLMVLSIDWEVIQLEGAGEEHLLTDDVITGGGWIFADLWTVVCTTGGGWTVDTFFTVVDATGGGCTTDDVCIVVMTTGRGINPIEIKDSSYDVTGGVYVYVVVVVVTSGGGILTDVCVITSRLAGTATVEAVGWKSTSCT